YSPSAEKPGVAVPQAIVFERWGYHQIITPTLERLETLLAGGAVDPSTVLQLHDNDNDVLGLRPELTAPIARAAVTRLAGVALPQRLYYNANVFRRSTQGPRQRQQEIYQSGVELLGAGGIMADGEVILLLVNCLNALGLNQWHLVLGEAELTRSLLEPFPESSREQVRTAIAHLDRLALDAMALDDNLKQRAITLFDLRGEPKDVLQRVSSLDLTAPQQTIVSNLKSLVEMLEASCPNQPFCTLPSFILDLSLIRPFDYYTGIVFEVIHQTATGYSTLGQGGRYDQLLGLYHPQGEGIPGIGFVLNMDDVQKVLAPKGHLPQSTPTSHWLIVPKSLDAGAAAFVYAQRIRESTNLVRVEVDLGLYAEPEKARTYAKQRQIPQIAWVDSDGIPDIEAIR
ncbi:MAG: ATP phosphoribosyltransferase regulatory subunit, partial [Merismopedia sp. SIO2A8]|nr:ATP phosphoribosyltransferase regulatory subunit [Merismopedia sp. SIO2A8]